MIEFFKSFIVIFFMMDGNPTSIEDKCYHGYIQETNKTLTIVIDDPIEKQQFSYNIMSRRDYPNLDLDEGAYLKRDSNATSMYYYRPDNSIEMIIKFKHEECPAE